MTNEEILILKLADDRRKVLDHAICRIRRASSRTDIIKCLLDALDDDTLTRESNRRLVTLFDCVKEFRLRDAL